MAQQQRWVFTKGTGAAARIVNLGASNHGGHVWQAGRKTCLVVSEPNFEVGHACAYIGGRPIRRESGMEVAVNGLPGRAQVFRDLDVAGGLGVLVVVVTGWLSVHALTPNCKHGAGHQIRVRWIARGDCRHFGANRIGRVNQRTSGIVLTCNVALCIDCNEHVIQVDVFDGRYLMAGKSNRQIELFFGNPGARPVENGAALANPTEYQVPWRSRAAHGGHPINLTGVVLVNR